MKSGKSTLDEKRTFETYEKCLIDPIFSKILS